MSIGKAIEKVGQSAMVRGIYVASASDD